jgi:hypothetical protein
MPETAPSANHDSPRGLPPVTPPSGKFIVQLFLVPGLIVAVVLVILLGFGYLVSSERTPEKFLSDLDSANADIRWRGAHDLAQVLKRPESLALASDPKFALDIATRLRKALAELEQTEKATAERVAKAPPDEQAAAWRGLSAQRNNVSFLMACLGDFTVPVGIPLLSEIALKEKGAELKSNTQRRRVAVLALTNLGENVKRRFLGQNARPSDKILGPAEKAGIVEELKREVAAGGERGEWAENALPYVLQGTPDVSKPVRRVAVDRTLSECARSEDPFLRELVAQALAFWDGELVEPTLLRLSRDDGHGPRIESGEND